jgi:hypothetical protein
MNADVLRTPAVPVGLNNLKLLLKRAELSLRDNATAKRSGQRRKTGWVVDAFRGEGNCDFVCMRKRFSRNRNPGGREIIRDLSEQMVQCVTAMVTGKTAIMRSRLCRGSLLQYKVRVPGLLMSQFIAKSGRPALHVCRKDKKQQQGNAADKTTHGAESTQESTGRQFLLCGVAYPRIFYRLLLNNKCNWLEIDAHTIASGGTSPARSSFSGCACRPYPSCDDLASFAPLSGP